MRVLVACEFSGIVRDAFKRRGHDAWSCDLLPTERPGNHIQDDVTLWLKESWDLVIAHPPCTYLSSSGMHWTKRGFRDPQLTEDALEFVRTILAANAPRICLENPVGVISSRIRKPDQIIQPWWFGEDASKKTCLWLQGLSSLVVTQVIPPKGWEVVKLAADMRECDCCGDAFCDQHQTHFAECPCVRPTEDEVTYATRDGVLFGARTPSPPHPVWGNQSPSGQNRLGPSSDRAKERSRTYLGIAEAMSRQWG